MKKNIFLLLTSGLLFFCITLIFFNYYLKLDGTFVITNRFHPELGWENIPNFDGKDGSIQYTHNSQGFRSQEIRQEKKQILLVGDSVTYGLGVNDNEIFSYHLSQKITDFQILNLGTTGYGLDQSYLRLEKVIDQLNPKLIIVLIFSGNDLRDISVDNHWGKTKPYYTIDHSKPVYQINQEALFTGNFNLGAAKTVNPDSLLLNNDHISQFSCLNLLSRGNWQWSLFAIELKNRLCKHTPPLSKLDQELVVKGILLKFKNLANTKKAKILFALSSHIDDFKYNSRVEFENILGKIRKLPLELQKERLDKLSFQDYRTQRHFSYLSLLTFQESIQELKLPLINFYEIAKEKKWNLEEIFNDGFHLSIKGHKIYSKVFFEVLKNELCLRSETKPKFCQTSF